MSISTALLMDSISDRYIVVNLQATPCEYRMFSNGIKTPNSACPFSSTDLVVKIHA